MSITLMAYPMAFLIAPEKAKNETLKRAADETAINKSVATKNLKLIKVLTNIQYQELKPAMEQVSCSQVSADTYYFDSGLRV